VDRAAVLFDAILQRLLVGVEALVEGEKGGVEANDPALAKLSYQTTR
jgi:hypothetical protein